MIIFTALKVFFLGIAVSIGFGPVNLAVFDRSVSGSMKQGFTVGLGAATIDALFCFLALEGFARLIAEIQGVEAFLYFIGGAILAALGTRNFFKKRNIERMLQAQTGNIRMSHNYILGASLAFFNPGTLFLWAAIGAFFFTKLTSRIDLNGSIMIAACACMGASLWFTFLSALIAYNKIKILRRAYASLDRLSPFIFIGLGVYFWIRLIHLLWSIY